MTWSLEDLAALERAIASGARRVRYADREVEYRTLDEMLRVRAEIRGALAPPRRRPRYHTPTFSKGLDDE
jgi:hypothetical protein